MPAAMPRRRSNSGALRTGKRDPVGLQTGEQSGSIGISELKLQWPGTEGGLKLLDGGDALEADVMALNRESDGTGDGAELIESRPGTSRPVIEAGSLAFETEGEEIAVFAEVVKKPGQPRLVSDAERFGERSRPVCDVLEVVVKVLPILPGRSGMSVVHLERLSDGSSPEILARRPGIG